jgi:hypothetical protein
MARAKKAHTVLGVFQTRVAAEDAILELKRVGFPDSAIGMVARNPDGTVKTVKGGETMAEEGLAAGAIVGAGAGTLIGLGVLAGTIPVIGPAIAAGTLGTILLNAGAGAVVVGIVGALIGMGIPEEDAQYYEEEVRGGRFLVTVDASDREAEAWTILRQMGAYNRAFPLAEPIPRNTRLPGELPGRPTTYPPS